MHIHRWTIMIQSNINMKAAIGGPARYNSQKKAILEATI